MLKVTRLNVTRLFIVEMTDSKPVELDPYHHAYALSCFGWRCIVCSIEAKDQIGLEMAWLGDEKVVYTDGIDGSKWVCCNGCKKCFHLSCVTDDLVGSVLCAALRPKIKLGLKWHGWVTIERLSGRRQGSGHIAGGTRKSRIMSKGTQAGHQVGHFNRFNR